MHIDGSKRVGLSDSPVRDQPIMSSVVHTAVRHSPVAFFLSEAGLRKRSAMQRAGRMVAGTRKRKRVGRGA